MTTHIVMIDGTEYDTQAEMSEYTYYREDDRPFGAFRGLAWVIAIYGGLAASCYLGYWLISKLF